VNTSNLPLVRTTVLHRFSDMADYWSNFGLRKGAACR